MSCEREAQSKCGWGPQGRWPLRHDTEHYPLASMHINPNTSNNAPQTHKQNQTNKEKSKPDTAVTVQQLP